MTCWHLNQDSSPCGTCWLTWMHITFKDREVSHFAAILYLPLMILYEVFHILFCDKQTILKSCKLILVIFSVQNYEHVEGSFSWQWLIYVLSKWRFLIQHYMIMSVFIPVSGILTHTHEMSFRNSVKARRRGLIKLSLPKL